MLQREGWRVRLVVSPAGSDIWQISPKLPMVAEHMLYAPEVDARLTYTEQFVNEISRMFNSDAPIRALYPILDVERFHTVSVEEMQERRRLAGIDGDAFVMCCHCNMRSVKRPDVVFRIARGVAERIQPRRAVLFMVGPRRQDVIVEPSSDGGSGLESRWTGIASHVEEYLWMSNVAINWSAHDSFNGSIMEAMGCGLPIVSTKVVGIAPEVTSAGSGRLFHDAEIDGAVEYISSLAGDAKNCRELGLRGSEHAHRVFSASALLPDYKRVLLPIG
jgi:glycosyltransferase involved in cell wall biosynthesis